MALTLPRQASRAYAMAYFAPLASRSRKPRGTSYESTQRSLSRKAHQACNEPRNTIHLLKSRSEESPAKSPRTPRRRKSLTNVDQVLVEIISSNNRGWGSALLLNVKSCLRKEDSFTNLFRKPIDIARRQTLLIVGDFNALYQTWGYKRGAIE